MRGGHITKERQKNVPVPSGGHYSVTVAQTQTNKYSVCRLGVSASLKWVVSGAHARSAKRSRLYSNDPVFWKLHLEALFLKKV